MPCHVQGTCQDANCLPGAPTTGTCEDGNVCTQSDFCSGGACIGGQAPDCDEGDVCTQDYCDRKDGQCVHLPTNCASTNVQGRVREAAGPGLRVKDFAKGFAALPAEQQTTMRQELVALRKLLQSLEVAILAMSNPMRAAMCCRLAGRQDAAGL